MSRLIWSPNSLVNVQRLYKFLAKTDIAAAKRAISGIRNSVRVLAQQPEIGRPVENMPNEFREWIIEFGDSGYVVRYRYEESAGDDIVILATRHQKETGFH